MFLPFKKETEECKNCEISLIRIPQSSISFKLNSLNPIQITSRNKKMTEVLKSFQAQNCNYNSNFNIDIFSSPLIEDMENISDCTHLLFSRKTPRFIDKICSVPIYETLDTNPKIRRIENLFLRHDLKEDFDILENSKYVATLFSKYLEGKDFETHDHNIRVGNMNQLIGRLLYEYVQIKNINHEITLAVLLNPDYFEMINYGGILHDIGKLFIPQNILLKPTKLTKTEYDLVKEHTTYGEILLDKLPTSHHGKIISAYHHEKWDGSGYNRYNKKTIPLSARITAFSDIFDAMTTQRAYKRAYSYAELHDFFYSNRIDCKGGFEGHFDPVILEFAKQYWETICSYHYELKKRTTSHPENLHLSLTSRF